MTDDQKNLVLNYLRRLDAKADQLIETLNDFGKRITSFEFTARKLAATLQNHCDEKQKGVPD